MKAVIAYIPVIHAGHETFFAKHKPDVLYILGRKFVLEFPRMERDMRALSDERIKAAAEAYGFAPVVKILDESLLSEAASAEHVVMPDEDLTRDFAEKQLKGKKVEFDTVFLRWHQMNSITKVPPQSDAVIFKDDFDKEVMMLAGKEAERSSDWWRQIGAVIVKEGKILFSSHNSQEPSERAPYIHGDPRSNFDAGQQPTTYTSIHAEASVIADAAREGTSLEGTSLYATTFPCSNCARLIARAGIKKVYYRDGYSVLDAEEILKISGAKLIRIEI